MQMNVLSSTLKRWGDLFTKPNHVTCSYSWEPVQRLTAAAHKHSERLRAALQEAIRESDERFRPMCDPLSVDLGTHRWLRNDREEAYSDWLAWTLEQLSDFAEIIDALTGSSGPALGKIPLPIQRERQIDGGRRLDLLVEVEQAILVVEVKLNSPDAIDGLTDQLHAYSRWIDKAAHESNLEKERVYRVLLVNGVANGIECDTGDFTVRRWPDVCLSLRAIVLTRLKSGTSPYPILAMIIALIGAVERNLLGLATPSSAPPNRPQALSFQETLDHLRNAKERNA